MTTPAPTAAESRPFSITTLLLLAAAFAVAHTQAPLYYSNQHQYFLHGLAQGGHGDLARDWLANTADPTPVFSAAVAWTYRHVGEWPFQAVYTLLLVVYFVSVAAIVFALPGAPRTRTGRFVALTLLIAVHAAVLRLASVRLTGVDYPWYFQSGVAGQYVLGPGLQPSAFGVLLVASIAAFVHGRTVLAAVLAVVACIVHATYLLPAAWLTLAYMHVLWHGGHKRAAVLLGAGTLLAVLPVVVYALRTFAPTTPEQFAEAQHVIVDLRIPHHARVDRWLDWIAWLQIAWMGMAIVLVRGTRLFWPMAISAGFGIALTLVQVATENRTLALLFPWRVSAVLMPVATAVILARLAAWRTKRLPTGGRTTALIVESTIWLVAVTAGGVFVMAYGLGYATNTAELPALEYIRDHRKPGDVYLVPVTVPSAPPAGARRRGPPSTSFTPPPRPTPGATLIAVDLQRFRLFTGAALYVDFKSIPYKDVDVLEWLRRLRQAETWYQSAWDRAVVEDLTRAGVTHMLAPADRSLVGEALEQVYADAAYRVYRVRPVSR